MENEFDKKAREWDKKQHRIDLSDKIAQRIKQKVKLTKELKVLDYGTGTGLILMNLQESVGEITGMDNSKNMLAVLQEKVKKNNLKNVTLIKHNGDEDEIVMNYFDLIVIGMTLHHIKDSNKFISKIYKSLKKGGIFSIIDLYQEDGTFHSKTNEKIHHFGFDEEKLANIMENCNFRDIEFEFLTESRKNNKKYPIFISFAKKSTE